MTSKSSTECFVYITLPGQTESVAAGRFEIAADRRGNALGRFVYGKKYLARPEAVAIDPVELKLSGNTQGVTEKDAETIRSAFVYDGFSY